MDEQVRPQLGIVDSLSLGFGMVARRPWLVILPVLLDLLLWFGPSVSVRPLVSRFLPLLQMPPGSTEELQQMATFSGEIIEQLGENWNLLTLLTRGMVSIPSFISSQLAPPTLWDAGVPLGVSSIGGALGMGLLAALVGTLLGGLYLALVADHLERWHSDSEPDPDTEEDSLPGSFLQRLGKICVRLVLLALLVLGGGLLVMVPVSVISGVLGVFSPSLAIGAVSLLSLLAVSLGLWVQFVLYFTTTAIVLDDVGVRQALWRSANVVWRNLWPTLGLVLLSYVIGTGFTLIWDRIAGTVWGTAAGILGTAYVGAALTAAGLAYYRDRRRHWQESLAPHSA